MKKAKEKVLAWHWTGSKLRDGSPIPRKGRWLKHASEVSICRSGLHASESLLDALEYAPGLILHRVECAEIVERQADKFVCCRRKILRSANMAAAIVQWANECAELADWCAAARAAAYARAAAADAAANAADAADAAANARAAAYAAASAAAAADAAAYAAYAAAYADAAAADAAAAYAAAARAAAAANARAAAYAAANAAAANARQCTQDRLIELFEMECAK